MRENTVSKVTILSDISIIYWDLSICSTRTHCFSIVCEVVYFTESGFGIILFSIFCFFCQFYAFRSPVLTEGDIYWIKHRAFEYLLP